MNTKLKIDNTLKQSGFNGFDHNARCYRCRKFYSRCNGMSSKSNAPCKRYVQENDTEKIKYTLGKEAMYKMGKLYDGKKCGVILVACKLSADDEISKVLGYKKMYVNTFEETMCESKKLEELGSLHMKMIYYISSDGKELALNQGRNELLFVKTDRDVTEDFKKVGLDVLSI